MAEMCPTRPQFEFRTRVSPEKLTSCFSSWSVSIASYLFQISTY